MTVHLSYDSLAAIPACEDALAAVGPTGLTLDADTLDRVSRDYPADAVAWGRWLITQSGLCPATLRDEYDRQRATLIRATLLAWGRGDTTLLAVEGTP